MKIYVLNAKNMPQSGTYEMQLITENEVKELITNATEIVSSVAYQNVSDILFEISNVRIPLDVEKRITKIYEEEAVILIACLKYRVPSEKKGILSPTKEDYEFYKAYYKKA